ncbi:MAG: hypothetical protein JWQ63_2637 [Mucilaginibacter sp.]|jgi:hypothetical protein|nr:hypothetical protein [Mucilaginibacter sp.]
MNRRTVIKNLALVIGGAALLPSCMKNNGGLSIHFKHLNISADQENLIGDICETIIPKTNTPGAKDLNLHLFVLKMLDDCYKKKDQQAFMVGLNQFNDMVKKKYNNSFSDLSVKEREDVLTALDKSSKSAADPSKSIKPVRDSQKSLDVAKKKPDVPPLNFFYGAIKQQTIFGYTNSKYFMTKQIVYELVPGRYNAHFPVKNLKTV